MFNVNQSHLEPTDNRQTNHSFNNKLKHQFAKEMHHALLFYCRSPPKLNNIVGTKISIHSVCAFSTFRHRLLDMIYRFLNANDVQSFKMPIKRC